MPNIIAVLWRSIEEVTEEERARIAAEIGTDVQYVSIAPVSTAAYVEYCLREKPAAVLLPEAGLLGSAPKTVRHMAVAQARKGGRRLFPVINSKYDFGLGHALRKWPDLTPLAYWNR